MKKLVHIINLTLEFIEPSIHFPLKIDPDYLGYLVDPVVHVIIGIPLNHPTSLKVPKISNLDLPIKELITDIFHPWLGWSCGTWGFLS